MSTNIQDMVRRWRQQADLARAQADEPENMGIADALLTRQAVLLQCADDLVKTAQKIINENARRSRKALQRSTKSYAPQTPSKPVRGPDGRFVKVKK